ncbi:C45 family peptidase [uncultured Imperialibacter sp.]|uniref:C45 family peptidase n=1 Tax=uncultured Imperialibacter sp. TaxID=1672639 RepID=UPI0030DB97F4|tara:strand:- start:102066 stop:103055 length:990 start_codon:yes stop_codon:yes gene_type:complete
MPLSFNCLQEEKPGEKWKALFDRTWPHYKTWFLSEGYMARKGYLTSASQLAYHMPELVPVYQQLMGLAGDGDLEGRFLSMYCPPAYMTACSQVAWSRDNDISLIRNYDYTFKMYEGTMLYTNWLQPVMGVSDCTWGLLDGMNASGLAASLTFGGRRVTGEGFGIPLVLRYVLEVAKNVDDAIKILSRVPVHMAYNVTVLDKSGLYATVYLSPDRAPVVLHIPVATNHQLEVEWTDYASLTGTIERKKLLEELVASQVETEASVLTKFMQPPLYNTNFDKSFGTLYTIMYKVQSGELEVHWPGVSKRQSFDDFREERVEPFSFQGVSEGS